MSIIKSMRQRLGLERKASPMARFGTAWLSTGDPTWTGYGYRALVQNGYQRNVIAHRAVRLVAECAASVPLKLYENGKRLDEHPVLSLLRSPNPMCVCASFLEEIYSHLLLAGNAYIEQVTTPSGEVAELYSLRPERMRVEPGPRGWPAAYVYEVGGEKRRYPVHAASGRSAILHVKSFHPLDDHYGLSALEAAGMGIDIHNAASSWNKALLDNAARPSGALVFEPGDGVPGNLTEEQIVRLKEDMAAQFQGAVNAGRPLLLEGGLKWQQMAFSPSDMDFINTKHVAAREIALAFGVPPMLLGIPGDNTYANYQEANRAFWRLTLLPLVDRVLGALGRWLGDDGGELRLEADRDQLTALAVERDALWARLGAAAFMTTNEKRAEVGLDPVEGGDGLGLSQAMGDAFGPFEVRGQSDASRETKEQSVVASRAARFADLKRELETAKGAGRRMKVWRTRTDGGVRESHRVMDGVKIGIDEHFNVAGQRLLLPSDPSGSMDETANCRCFVEYVEDKEKVDIPDSGIPAPITRGDNAILTEEDIAHIVFNESASLSGPNVERARKAIAHAVINADERFGSRRPGTASHRINRELPKLEQNILGEIKTLVAEVREERSSGVDSSLGNNYFNFRDATDPIFEKGEEDVRTLPKVFRNGVKQPVVTSFGPFFNSNPRPSDRMFSKDQVFLVILKGEGRVVK